MPNLLEIDCHLKWYATYKFVLSYKFLPKSYRRQALDGLRSCVSWLVGHGVSDVFVIDNYSVSCVSCRVGSFPHSLDVRLP